MKLKYKSAALKNTFKNDWNLNVTLIGIGKSDWMMKISDPGGIGLIQGLL